MLGCFNPTLGQIWTYPAIGLNFFITFLTQRLGLSIFESTQHFTNLNANLVLINHFTFISLC